MYAISKLINEVISSSKLRKREVVLSLGYKNLHKGFRRLNTLIETGECPQYIKDRLPQALNLDKELVDTAFKLTAQEKAKEAEIARQSREEYERKSFVPHIWTEYEIKYPTGAAFWYIALIGLDKFKVLSLPEDINEMDWDEQQAIVKERILEHHKHCSDDAIFGRVKGYTYCQTYDDSFLLSVDGKRVYKVLDVNIEKVNGKNLSKSTIPVELTH